MGGHKALRSGPVDSAEKENKPPKKAKRSVAISSLFEQIPRKRQSPNHGSRDILAARHAGVSKQHGPKQNPFAQYLTSRSATKHPVFLNFAKVANDYHQASTIHAGRQLEPVYKELLARVDCMDMNGKPMTKAGMSIKAETDSAITDRLALSKPLEEERMTIQNQRKNGLVTTKDVKLGDTLQACQSLTDQTRKETESLVLQLKGIDAEIADLKNDLLDTESGAWKKAQNDLDTDLAALAEKAKVIKKQTIADVKETRKADNKFSKEMSRKIEEFMATL